jgi:hypothetical protein
MTFEAAEMLLKWCGLVFPDVRASEGHRRAYQLHLSVQTTANSRLTRRMSKHPSHHARP